MIAQPTTQRGKAQGIFSNKSIQKRTFRRPSPPLPSPLFPCPDRHRYRKAAVKQNSLARELRESFVRLDLRHRNRNQNKEQERRHVKPRDAGAGDAADDPGHGQEEGGRQRPIDVETSLSVRLGNRIYVTSRARFDV